MIQRRIQNGVYSVPRKVVAAMLVLWLNLALLPCAIALEVAEVGHECCPQSVELQQLDCCELDDVTHDHRDSVDLGGAIAGSAECKSPLPPIQAMLRHVPQPPNPGGSSPPIHVLNCVYLK